MLRRWPPFGVLPGDFGGHDGASDAKRRHHQFGSALEGRLESMGRPPMFPKALWTQAGAAVEATADDSRTHARKAWSLL